MVHKDGYRDDMTDKEKAEFEEQVRAKFRTIIQETRLAERQRILNILQLSTPENGLWAWTIAFSTDLPPDRAKAKLEELSQQGAPPLSQETVEKVVRRELANRRLH